MVFNSWPFIFVFLPITLAGFHLLAKLRIGWAQVWLIGASLFFYAYWKVEYLPLLVGSMIGNFLLSRWMNLAWALSYRKMFLVLGLTANLMVLGYFKYTNFFLSTLKVTGLPVPAGWDIALPLAISFFTFTQIAYLVDVFRDKSLHYSLVDYAFFVVFFPHLIAGPIVRHSEIIPQLRGWAGRLGWQGILIGLTLFTIGLCKKCFLADALAPHVQNVYGVASQGLALGMKDAWLGTLAFAFQIYFDFSAYSDMALGLALMFGLRFPANFNSPYKGGSIIEFWSNWHMTLTRFLREYVYFSLGGNRLGPWRQAINVLVTMLLSGLWHGAGWTFIIWGGLHGCFIMVDHVWRNYEKWLGLHSSLLLLWCGRALTLVAVLFAWVWFRAGQVQTAWGITRSMLGCSAKNTGVSLIGPALECFLPVLLLAVWLLPNSQQILCNYKPTLERIEMIGRGRFTLNCSLMVLLGLVFFLVTREFFVSRSTLFIYFKF